MLQAPCKPVGQADNFHDLSFRLILWCGSGLLVNERVGLHDSLVLRTTLDALKVTFQVIDSIQLAVQRTRSNGGKAEKTTQTLYR